MSAQSEALRLADALEMSRNRFRREAAAELRRLHAECNDLAHQLNESNERNGRIIAQRDALLEALKSTGLFLHHCWCDVQMNDYSFEKLNHQMAVVDAAIKAVEGETK